MTLSFVIPVYNERETLAPLVAAIVEFAGNDLLELWQDERFTVIFVTHSVFESVFLSNRIVVMAARPGRVFDEVAVDAAYPRGETFRTSPEYAALCRKTSDVLVGAINTTAASKGVLDGVH